MSPKSIIQSCYPVSTASPYQFIASKVETNAINLLSIQRTKSPCAALFPAWQFEVMVLKGTTLRKCHCLK